VEYDGERSESSEDRRLRVNNEAELCVAFGRIRRLADMAITAGWAVEGCGVNLQSLFDHTGSASDETAGVILVVSLRVT
jgi:hypothetical protein